MKKCEMIDFFKGFSIIAIVLFHLIAYYSDFPQIIKKMSFFGGAGVHIFIFCSGFGLTFSYLKNKDSIKKFFFKRIKKTYIPYIIIVLISFFIPFMYYGNDRIQALLSHIFLYKMFIEQFVDSFGIHFWFISTIFQFYFFYYLIMFIKSKIHNKKFFILSFFISLLWATFISAFRLSDYRIFSSFFLQYLWEFSLGIIFAEYFLTNKIKQYNYEKWLLIVTPVAILLYVILAFKGGIFKNFNDIFGFISICSIGLILNNISIVKKYVCMFQNFLMNYI